MTRDELFQRIVDVAPGFAVVRAEHLRGNYDELLPHELMNDLRLYVSLAFGAPDTLEGLAAPPSEQEVRAILEVLDRGLAEGDEATDNVIGVSFVEYLWDEPYFARLEPLLGPELRAEVQRQREWGAGADACIGRGYMSTLDGQFEQAIASFDTAIELDPGLAQAYECRGYAYAQLGQKEQALADYDKALALSTDPAFRAQIQQARDALGAP